MKAAVEDECLPSPSTSSDPDNDEENSTEETAEAPPLVAGAQAEPASTEKPHSPSEEGPIKTGGGGGYKCDPVGTCLMCFHYFSDRGCLCEMVADMEKVQSCGCSFNQRMIRNLLEMCVQVLMWPDLLLTRESETLSA